MSTSDVWLLGGYQTDFARNFSREGLDFADLTGEVVRRTLESSKVDAGDIGVVHVGNAFGELFAGQGHLGAMPATVCDDLWGVPATRHEAACASGSAAVLAAMADLRSGAYSSALVVGVELEKTVPGDTATRYLGAAAWIGHAGADAKYIWPCMFSEIADEYDRCYGLDEAYLRAIAERNFANARKNPSAQTPSPSRRCRRSSGRPKTLTCCRISGGRCSMPLTAPASRSTTWTASRCTTVSRGSRGRQLRTATSRLVGDPRSTRAADWAGV